MKEQTARYAFGRHWNRHRDRFYAVLSLLPSLVLIFVFVYLLIGWNTVIAFSKWHGLKTDLSFNGLKNFIELFQDARFQIGMRNMGVFALVFISGCIVLGFLLALLLDQGLKWEGFFRNLYIYPLAISLIVTGVVWRWLFTPGSEQTGWIGLNQLFDFVGLHFLKSGWHTSQSFGIVAVAIAATWQMSGYVMAMYLAAIRSIPVELKEAAVIDGASPSRYYLHIVIPLVRTTTVSAVVILGHIALRVFDLVAAMTGSGKGFITDVPAFYMWQTSFQGNRFNRGAAIALVLLVLISGLVIPYIARTYRTSDEQGG
jgi:glucose/mannose transport system permease protein